MKKLVFLLVAVFLTVFGAKTFAQGVQQSVIINATHNYYVNSSAYATAPTGDAATNTYAWAVYAWNGTEDYTSDNWDAVGADASSFSGATDVDYNTQITWLAGGNYVIEVVETNGKECKTKRRFGIEVMDLDLLVVTADHSSTTITDSTVYCNTNEGDIWGDSDADDLNDESLETMTMTYTISLYTIKGNTDDANLIGDINEGKGAAWKFTLNDNSTIPTVATTPVTWTVFDANETVYTTGAANTFTVAAGTSVVTITATIQNIAADVANKYNLDFSIDPATVLVENGGSDPNDYAEGQEPTDYVDGTAEPDSHRNDAAPITVNPIPNTSRISFN